jgi:hypothetical protein
MNGIVIFVWGNRTIVVRRDQVLRIDYPVIMERIDITNIYGSTVEIELDDDNAADQDATAEVGKEMLADLCGVGHPAGGGLGTRSGIAVWRQKADSPGWQREIVFP